MDSIARAELVRRLLALQTPDAFWEGELSSSALSTATAVVALHHLDTARGTAEFASQIRTGLDWLAVHQNADGGWGDTTKSQSNLSTTTLVWDAFGCCGTETENTLGESWLTTHLNGPPNPERLSQAILNNYGKDRTFSVPILTMTALSGRLGPVSEPATWKPIIPLPFELARIPHQAYKMVRLPVVSYALPALIAIGQARHHFAPSRNPLLRKLRSASVAKTMAILERIQPTGDPGGGFLEATPLTSFVLMSLAASGREHHIVSERCARFITASMRADGSWPIDTHLATWVTTLAVNALGDDLPDESRAPIRDWLLAQQWTTEHPYTHAAPGGWAWTPLPGGVPDADDTPGALLALHKLTDGEYTDAIGNGITWLLDLQNRDGGFPTFCCGWGTLPFDKSACDLTGHVLRAFVAWRSAVPEALGRRIDRATARATRFLLRRQTADGAWHPLWFGNEHTADQSNPVFGTARVLIALDPAEHPGPVARGLDWLEANQNADGGWGGVRGCPSNVEETSLAIQAIRALRPDSPALAAGERWLIDRIDAGPLEDAPIGLYFARLWYHEKLYPLVFALGALPRPG